MDETFVLAERFVPDRRRSRAGRAGCWNADKPFADLHGMRCRGPHQQPVRLRVRYDGPVNYGELRIRFP